MERFVAAAEQAGVPDAQRWVEFQIGQLVTIPVEGTQTVADVYAYASETRQQQVAALPPLPGLNPGAVTDAHLAAAIAVVNTASTTA